MNIINLRNGISLSVLGLCIVVAGSLKNHLIMVRFTGVLVALVGLTTMGKRIYERIKEKRRAKLFYQNL